MKITFFRQGHSNNSSSSHSLIFTSKNVQDTSNGLEFGWDNFTCSDKQSKINYVMNCLYSSWLCTTKVNTYFKLPHKPYNRDPDLYEQESSSFLKNHNLRVKLLFDSYVASYLKDCFGRNKYNYDLSGYVDHQSMLAFPVTRDGDSVHAEFANDFIKEFVNGNWYVFGGNDNDGYCEPGYPDEHAGSMEDYKKVWSFLTDQTNGSIICVYDDVTEEYVLSRSGGLIKIKF